MDLKAGSQVMHNGFAVELLYQVRSEDGRETWRVRPLFSERPDRDELFLPFDRVSALHTRKAA